MEAVEILRPHKLARLVGAAGTGKSFVAVRLPELLGLGERVVFAAPSHTARRVLKWKAADDGIDIRTVTTRSLLWERTPLMHCRKCLPKDRERAEGACPCLVLGGGGCSSRGVPGEVYCGQWPEGPSLTPKPFWQDWDSVIVDETSMVSRDDFDALMAGREHLSGRLIFTGDVCQLPAVGNKGWSALTAPMPEAKLVKVRRTDAGPIIAGATHLRRILDPAPGDPPTRGGSAEHFLQVAEANPLPDVLPPDVQPTSVHRFPVDQPNINAALARLGNAMQLWSGWEEFVILTHTHAHRAEWNRQVRRAALRGDEPEEGDVVMMSDQHDAKDAAGRTVEVTKWSRAVVRTVEPGPAGCSQAPEGKYARKAAHARCWFVGLELPGYGPDGSSVLLPDQHVTDVGLNCARPTDGAVPGWIWGFAMTVYTAQGDAFDHVVMHESSTTVRADEPLAGPQRVYTAVSRARRTVTVMPTGARVPSYRPLSVPR